ncbi:hypothetical protein VTO73DRAFT_12259 [Trametes versicolor]
MAAVLSTNVSSAMALPAGMPPALDDTLGAMLIGAFISTILYGLTLNQISRYYELYPVDTPLFRIMVPTLFILETVHTVCILESIYYYLVANQANPSSIAGFHPPLKLVIPITAVTTLLCHSFYARRVYLFGSHHRMSVVIAALFSMAKMGFCVAATVEVFSSPLIITIEKYSWMVSASYGCTFVADALLTGTLIYILLHSRTGFKRTDSIVETLALYTTNTGLLTSTVGVIVFILALVQPNNLIWAGVGFVSNKLYANAVLAVLNSRRSLASNMFEKPTEAEAISTRTRSRRTHPNHGADPNPSQVPIMLPDDSDYRHGTREPRLGYSLSGRSHSDAHGQDTKTFRFVSTV